MLQRRGFVMFPADQQETFINFASPVKFDEDMVFLSGPGFVTSVIQTYIIDL